MVCRLAVGDEVEILEAGTDSEGRRFKAKDKQGRMGWLSALTAEGTYLLEVTQRGSQSLYVGEGQALGGGASVDPRQAALAAAERRQASALSRGVGEKAAKTLQQSGQREAAMKKITELYAKRREDVPITLQSASLEALQKHLEHEEQRVTAPAAAKEEPSVRQRPPPQNFTSFAPEPRRAPEPQMPKASAPAASTPASSAGDAWKRQEATTRGLSSDQFEAVLSIESLLGFDFSRALQAFISAGCDQELAANLLLEEGQEAPEQPLANFGAPGLPQPSYIVTRRVPGAFPGPPLDEKQWRLSPSEEAAVKRLQDLGFDRPTAFKAFWNCHKNEEEAGNRLLL